jgi:hypothetical protein
MISIWTARLEETDGQRKYARNAVRAEAGDARDRARPARNDAAAVAREAHGMRTGDQRPGPRGASIRGRDRQGGDCGAALELLPDPPEPGPQRLQEAREQPAEQCMCGKFRAKHFQQLGEPKRGFLRRLARDGVGSGHGRSDNRKENSAQEKIFQSDISPESMAAGRGRSPCACQLGQEIR